MEFQTLKRSHLKRNIIIGVLVVGIISAVVLNFTRAKYRATESMPLVNGTINYELSDLNLIGVYIEDGEDYKKVDQIPDSGYTLNEEKSYCKIGDQKQNMTITYDMNTKNLTIAPMTKKGTKCYLYFDEQKILLADAIKRDNQINSGTPNFGSVATTNEGVYKTQDDWGDSYYFRGSVNNNWVKFAGYYWRIIRINGDGSIRLIYSGTSTATTGTSTQISTSKFNSSYNDNAYVGYMYGSTGASTYAATHANNNNSTIKGVLDSWYTENIADKGYGDKVSTEAGFCNDRRIAGANETFWSSDTKKGYGTNTTAYAPFSRFLTISGSWASTQNPTLKCSQLSSDMFTPTGSSKGNKKLTNPIGLITADEVVMGGLPWSGSTTSNYLYTGQHYWTMSPYIFDGYNARVFHVYSNGYLSYDRVDFAYGVRPVINLAHDVTIKSGNGTSSTPYEI